MNHFPRIPSTQTRPVECLSKYIGIPFKPFGRTESGLDCWGLVRLFYKNEFDIVLPGLAGYESVKDHRAISDIVETEKPRWVETRAEFGHVIVFNMAGRPVHVGVVIDNLRMLHIQTGKNSCLEKFRSPRWKNRIEGIYQPNTDSYKCQATPVTG